MNFLRLLIFITVILNCNAFLPHIPKKIILLGMPQVGQTTLGKTLNIFTGIPFHDTRTFFTIEKTHNTLLKEESELIKKITTTTSFIVATSSSFIDLRENVDLLISLKKNDVLVIFIDRNEGRPFLNFKWKNIYFRRKRIMKDLATKTYTNTKNPLYFISWLIQN